MVWLVAAGRGVRALAAVGPGRVVLRAANMASSVASTVPGVVFDAAASKAYAGDLVVLPFYKGENLECATGAAQEWDAALAGAVRELIAEHDFDGSAAKEHVAKLVGAKDLPVRKVAIYGLGEAKGATKGGGNNIFAKLGAFAAETAKTERCRAVAIAPPASAPVEASSAIMTGALEASYVDDRFKTADFADDPSKLERVTLLDAGDVNVAAFKCAAVASGVSLARDLVNAPPNVMYPKTLADTATGLAAEFPATLSAKVLGPEECAELGMFCYLGVGQGASDHHEPKFIHLTYAGPSSENNNNSNNNNKKKKRVLCVIGKGLTYDSGGYNLKPSSGGMIELMKFDMGGSAATLGAAKAVAKLSPPDLDVHFIVAACENMVSADAMRPGDILQASNGKTVEVINTDAEGRLTLADALVYAEKLAPDAIVDLATLTGACIVALGDKYAGLYSADNGLASGFAAAAARAGEKVWRMPLAPEYEDTIKSKIADLRNLGGKGAGSITAALFLQHFVEKTPWVHLDMAGPVWDEKNGRATGYGVKTLVEWITQEEEVVV